MNKELLKGTTDMMILRLLSREPMYGYGMIKNFEIMSKGNFTLKEGTLYPILHALEKKGHIEAYWDLYEGRKRKYYKITDKGRGSLDEKRAEWDLFATSMREIMDH